MVRYSSEFAKFRDWKTVGFNKIFLVENLRALIIYRFGSQSFPRRVYACVVPSANFFGNYKNRYNFQRLLHPPGPGTEVGAGGSAGGTADKSKKPIGQRVLDFFKYFPDLEATPAVNIKSCDLLIDGDRHKLIIYKLIKKYILLIFLISYH